MSDVINYEGDKVQFVAEAALLAIYLRQLEWSQRIMANLNSKLLVEIPDALESIGQIMEKRVHVSTEED